MKKNQIEPAHPHPFAPFSVLAVVVVFRQQPAATTSLQSLLAASRAATTDLRLAIHVVDNTPGGQDPGDIPSDVQYRAAPDNPGLATPYNEALAFATQNGFDWLLTLDQDTQLPRDFLQKLHASAEQNRNNSRVAAIVPQVSDHGRVISPFRFVGGFLPRVLGPETRGISDRHTSAINSASLLRVQTLAAIGGYEPRFPLHQSDTRLFQRLDELGYRVFIAREIDVHHELAILRREDRMSAERYRMLLRDECDFWDRHMGMLGRAERLIRLLGRVCKGFLQQEDPVFRTIAMREILRRLVVRRKGRIRASEEKFSRLPDGHHVA